MWLLRLTDIRKINPEPPVFCWEMAAIYNGKVIIG